MLWYFNNNCNGVNKMTRKDYIKFADLFIKLIKDKKWNGINGATEQQLLQGFINIFQTDNSRFSADRFLNYINGYTEELNK